MTIPDLTKSWLTVKPELPIIPVLEVLRLLTHGSDVTGLPGLRDQTLVPEFYIQVPGAAAGSLANSG